MANKYITVAGAGSKDGSSWANAYDSASLEAALEGPSAGEYCYIDQGTYTIASDMTFDLQSGAIILATNDTANAIPTVLGTATIDGSGTAGVDIVIRGSAMVRGIIFKSGGSASAANITLSNDADTVSMFRNCTFNIVNSSGSSRCYIGSSGADRIEVETIGCTFLFGTTTQYISLNSRWTSIGDAFASSGSVPATLVGILARQPEMRFFGADMGALSGTLVTASGSARAYAELYGCKLHASVTIFNPASLGRGDVYLYDCDSGDVHYKFAHYNPCGSTVVSTSVYITADGATYDGTNRYSWLVSSTSLARPANPYKSPWVPVYRGTTGSVTPRLECLRKGSTTRYKDMQVWAEWLYQGTSGFPLAVYDNDRDAVMNPTGSDQAASSLTASDWTGEDGSSNDFFKLGPSGAITVQEIGTLAMRVCIAAASVTDVYVDPKIRV